MLQVRVVHIKMSRKSKFHRKLVEYVKNISQDVTVVIYLK